MIWKDYSRRAVTVAVTVMSTAFALYGQSSEAVKNYTGDGGKGISLTIYAPQSTGLTKERNYIPALVQGEFVDNFSEYSAISILGWERLDDIYVKLSAAEARGGKAAETDEALGRLAPTTHFLTGNITQTADGYNLKVNITAAANKMTLAAYSGKFTFAELDDLTGVRRASLELLQKAGVKLTDKAKRELAGAPDANRISARAALAKGVTAQMAGAEVAALSYYYQAANINPSLKEAVKRSAVAAAGISSGNIGADIRNDIAWRKKWLAKLKETEEAFFEMITADMANAAGPPYKLIYFLEVKTDKINYKTETADLSFIVNMSADWAWFNATKEALGAAQAVLNGLNATKRRDDWNLSSWPWTGVSNTNPFASDQRVRYDVAAAFELVNKQGRVIGGQTVTLKPGFHVKRVNVKEFPLVYGFVSEYVSAVTFKGVKAGDIGDDPTVRVASVNGAPPQQARFPIAAMPMFEKTKPFTDARDGKKYNTVRIGGKTWMTENLNYRPKAGGSWCSNNDSSKCVKYGRLYDWNTAATVCPDGWHLSSPQEWDYLAVSVGGESSDGHRYRIAGKKLKSKTDWAYNTNGTDDYGFSALPGAYRFPDGDFLAPGAYGYWWTSTARNSEDAYCREIAVAPGYDENNLSESHFGKGHGLSVRCVQN